jgi:MFS family permease
VELNAGERGWVALATLTAGSTTLAYLPAFLLGGLAALLRDDLGLNEAGLGLAVATFFAASAVSSVPGGRASERIGARSSILVAGAASVVALVAIGTLTSSAWHLYAFLVVAGVANGVAQPASNLALAHGADPSRRALAFGIKQSAIPFTGLIAGVAVPLLAVPFGWRSTFLASSLMAVFLLLLPHAPGRVAAGSGARPRLRVRTRGLVVLATGAGLGAAAANSLGAFLALSAVERDVDVAVAGLLLALGSGVSILVRLTVGWSADRWRDHHLLVVAVMMALGLAGFTIVAFAGSTTMIALGAMIAFGAGWGWPGLFHLAVVNRSMHAPGASTGVTQTGVFLGGMLGPLGFGVLVGSVGYTGAWLAAGVTSAAAGVLVVLGARSLRSEDLAAAQR